MRKKWISGILCVALTALAIGCAKKNDQNAAVTAQKQRASPGSHFL